MAQILSSLSVNEVSLVDAPANSSIINGRKVAHARVALFKRDGSLDGVGKAGAVGVKFVIGFPKEGDGGSKVQSVIFDKDQWTIDKAKTWLKGHDFRGLSVDETGESFRFRQEDPEGFSRFRTITPGEAKKYDKEGDRMDDLKQRVMKYLQLYPPLGNSTDKPKAQTFSEVYARLETQEEFEEMGNEFQEKLNALQQTAWSIVSDPAAANKQALINVAVDEFVASVKAGLSEADEPYYKMFEGDWNDADPICKAIDGIGKATEDGKLEQDGKRYPKSDYAFTPDDTPSHWKIRLTSTPGGEPDAQIVGAAVAALGKGFRGKKAKIPADARASVTAKVRAAWRKANPDKGDDELPTVLKSAKEGVPTMTLEQIEKRLTEQETTLTTLQAENTVLKTENDLVLKMSKKNRKLYATMSAEKRKEFMAGNEEKRKAMMDEAATEKMTKALEDSMDEATKKRYAKAGPAERKEILTACEKKAKAKGDGKDSEDDTDEDDMEETTKMLKQDLAAAHDRVTKTEQALADIRKRERTERFQKRAEDELPHTPGSPMEKGLQIEKLADSLGEDSPEFKSALATLKSADKILGMQFHEIGKAGGPVPAEHVWNAKVTEIAKRDNISEPKAVAKAMEESPELYLDYERQHNRAIAQR